MQASFLLVHHLSFLPVLEYDLDPELFTHAHVGGVPPVPKDFQSEKSLTVLREMMSPRSFANGLTCVKTDHAILMAAVVMRPVVTGFVLTTETACSNAPLAMIFPREFDC
jgi:hypothetical protein